MKDMIKRIREEREGFTLAELLIVVAIIAVLVAIAIPVFNGQLEKSRDAVTVANLRTAYAEAQTAYLTGSSNGDNVTYNKNTDGTATVVVKDVVAKGQSGDFSNLDAELPFHDKMKGCETMGGTAGTYTVTFAYNSNGAITIVAATQQK